MSDNNTSQDDRNMIIDSYDGDPDEQVFFQSPVKDEMAAESQRDSETKESTINDHEVDASSEYLKEFYANVPDEDESELQMQIIREDQPAAEFVVTPIDVNDPHYANYTPDPYYDYGYGPEPEAKKIDDKKDGSTLGVVSLSTGIAANVLCCCGLNYVCSLAAIITGIVCLCTKGITTSERVMAIIGIVLGLFPFLLLILNVVLNIGTTMMPYMVNP